MEEIWKQHRTGHWVSNLGRIKGKYRRPEFLKASPNTYGYPTIGLSDGTAKAVHRMVCETFIGPIPKGYTVNHKNGIKNDNRLDNLEIVPHRENVLHSFRTGLKSGVRGERAANVITTEKQVIEIYKLIKDGKTNTEIAKMFNLKAKHISAFRCGRTWSHLYKQFFNTSREK